ncbi:MAG: hypothetical protein ACI8Q1_000461 [Parvicella sp.]|jgi:uncharacterized protein involved in exopolysaccharide biosynthesis
MTNLSNNSEKDEIDLFMIFKKLWIKRRTILVITLFGAVTGLLIGLFTPNSFTASSTFVPQTSDSNPTGSLGGLAAIAGIDLGTSSAGGDIPLQLYPKIVSSIPFHLEILRTIIYWESGKGEFADYLLKDNDDHATLDTLVVNSLEIEPNGKNVWNISERVHSLIEESKDKIKIETNRDGYVKISVSDKQPQVAAQIAKAAEQVLQQRVIEYKIASAKLLYEFTRNQWLQKRAEFYNIQDSLARFSDENQNITSPYVLNERKRLETRYDILNSVYSELWSQKEQTALQLEKDTPIFIIIDPVIVPYKKSSPQRFAMLLLFTSLAFVFSASFFFIKDVFLPQS